MSEDLGVDFDNVPLEAWSVPVRAPVCHDPEATSRAMVCWIWNLDAIRAFEFPIFGTRIGCGESTT